MDWSDLVAAQDQQVPRVEKASVAPLELQDQLACLDSLVSVVLQVLTDLTASWVLPVYQVLMVCLAHLELVDVLGHRVQLGQLVHQAPLVRWELVESLVPLEVQDLLGPLVHLEHWELLGQVVCRECKVQLVHRVLKALQEWPRVQSELLDQKARLVTLGRLVLLAVLA
jgi:hypothetical protein